MTAAVWSTPPDVCAIDFPAKTLIRFMYNHHLLQMTGKPSWLTINIIFACHSDDALRILDAGSGATPGEREVLDAFRWSRNEVCLHTDENVSFHSPLVLEEEMEPDGWAYQLMPRSRLAWSCWNYITRTAVDEQGKMKANDPQVSL